MPVTKQEPRYDVFISYCRGAANALALLLQTQLQRPGIAAFLDRDLRRGVFDDMLLRRIAESPSFLIILTPHALDGCTNEEDWLRKEIVQAISSKRNIIPLQVDSFQFAPELVKSLDPAIRELSRYQTVVYSHDYFENTVERIVKIVEEDKAERTGIQEAEALEEKRFAAESTASRGPELKPNLVAGSGHLKKLLHFRQGEANFVVAPNEQDALKIALPIVSIPGYSPRRSRKQFLPLLKANRLNVHSCRTR